MPQPPSPGWIEGSTGRVTGPLARTALPLALGLVLLMQGSAQAATSNIRIRDFLYRPDSVLISTGEGRKDTDAQMTGRARDNRLVHLPRVDGVRPGDVVEVEVTGAAPHYLRADGRLLSHRRTRAGDAAEAGRTPTTPGVLLGMPRVPERSAL